MLDIHAKALFLAARTQALGLRADRKLRTSRRISEKSEFVRFRAPSQSDQ